MAAMSRTVRTACTEEVSPMTTLIEVRDLSKTFTLHQHNGVVLNVLRGLNFSVRAGECLVLSGQSGAGKS
ncbi:Phosphonate metabolism protein PhnL, partial [Pseudomonas syringae pv. aptata]